MSRSTKKAKIEKGDNGPSQKSFDWDNHLILIFYAIFAEESLLEVDGLFSKEKKDYKNNHKDRKKSCLFD